MSVMAGKFGLTNLLQLSHLFLSSTSLNIGVDMDGSRWPGMLYKTSLTNMSPARFTNQIGETSERISCLSTSVAWGCPSAEVGKLIDPFSTFYQWDWQLHGTTHMEATALGGGQQIVSNKSEPEF